MEEFSESYELLKKSETEKTDLERDLKISEESDRNLELKLNPDFDSLSSIFVCFCSLTVRVFRVFSPEKGQVITEFFSIIRVFMGSKLL